MSAFWSYFQMGLYYVWNINAYNHIFFLIALIVAFSFKEWKRILLLGVLFTVGHLIGLVFSGYQILVFDSKIIEIVVLITIAVTAFTNFVEAGKPVKKEWMSFRFFIAILSGIAYGFYSAVYLKNVFRGSFTSNLLPTLEFVLGVDSGQIIVIFVFLTLLYSIQTISKFSKRDLVLIFSSLIIGIVFPLILKNEIWHR